MHDCSQSCTPTLRRGYTWRENDKHGVIRQRIHSSFLRRHRYHFVRSRTHPRRAHGHRARRHLRWPFGQTSCAGRGSSNWYCRGPGFANNWQCMSRVTVPRLFTRMSKSRRTWYTVPPPLRRLIQGIPLVSDAARLTSFQGFWFRPMTTHGASL